MGMHPIIQTVVRNGEVNEILRNSTTARGQHYDVEFVGSFEELYSYDMILNHERREEMLLEEKKWNPHARYTLQSEYHARVMEAMILFRHLGSVMGVAEERFPAMEHRSWVNFMYAEGYQLRENAPREDIAKLHPDLVEYEELEPRS